MTSTCMHLDKKRLYIINVFIALLTLMLFSETVLASDTDAGRNHLARDNSEKVFYQWSLGALSDSQPYLYSLNQNRQIRSVGDSVERDNRGKSMGTSMENMHKYLGFGAVLVGAIAGTTQSEKDLHYASAYSATGLAVAAWLTGYWEHGYRFDLSKGFFDEDNLHVILGTIGTAALIAAVASADSGESGSHGGIGIGGTASMAASIITIKW